MTELSPAQVVLAAVKEISPAPADEIAAAALRAAVDQAIPLTNTPWGSTLVPVLTSWESRDRLLAIATELKNHAN
ncbi:hypothetical protein EBT31_02045 [bacterium]|nr:hypothetical protein [bacterium]